MHSETLLSNLDIQLTNAASLLLCESGKLQGGSSKMRPHFAHLNARKYNFFAKNPPLPSDDYAKRQERNIQRAGQKI